MNTPYTETNCIIEHDGHTFEAGGAIITEDRAIAYLANETLPTPWIHRSGRETYYARKTGTERWRGTLTTWHGEKIGTYVITGTWYSRGTLMYSIVATINGRTYHGRTQGPGMYVRLRAHKNQ